MLSVHKHRRLLRPIVSVGTLIEKWTFACIEEVKETQASIDWLKDQLAGAYDRVLTATFGVFDDSDALRKGGFFEFKNALDPLEVVLHVDEDLANFIGELD